MFYRTDDPIADFNRYDREQAMERRKLPRCCECGARIYDEEAFIMDGETFCRDCIAVND